MATFDKVRIDGTVIPTGEAIDPGAFAAEEGTPAAADAYSVGTASATFVGVASGVSLAAMYSAGVATATATNELPTSAAGESDGAATSIASGASVFSAAASSIGVSMATAGNVAANSGGFSSVGAGTATGSGYGFYFRERRYNGTVDMTDYVRNR